MRKVILNLAVSLDGFIARKDDRVDWLDNLDTGNSDLGFVAFLESCDTLIMGRKSYETTHNLGNGVWPFKGKKTYVFTRQNLNNLENIQFVNTKPERFIQDLLKEEGSNIWLFGGGSFIKLMKELNLIDEYIITTIPVFLGSGIKLFEETDREDRLELIEVDKVNSIIQTRYKVIK